MARYQIIERNIPIKGKLFHFVTTLFFSLLQFFSEQYGSLPNHFISSQLSFSPIKTARYQTVEHVVLFKVKPNTDQTMVDAMVEGLNNLKTMKDVNVLHLISGPIYRVHSSANLTFTHFLHARYENKEDLAAFMANPQHLKLVHDYTDPLTEDYMIVNWVVNHDEPVLVHPALGDAMRVMFFKLKEGVDESGKKEVLDVVREAGLQLNAVQFTCGKNYDEAAKGYQIASLVVFEQVKELESIGEFAKWVEDKVKDFVEVILVVDYVV